MPVCSIKECSARKSKNRPNLSHHCVPKNEVRRRKWLDAIGPENLNPRHKELLICSLHFEESQFNRTLDQVRLREDAVPTLFNVPSSSKHVVHTPKENLDPSPDMLPTSRNVPVLCETGNIQGNMVPMKYLVPTYDTPASSATSEATIFEEKVVPLKDQPANTKQIPSADQLPTSRNVPVLCETGNIQGNMVPMKYLIPTYDTPASSATSEATIFEEKVVPLKYQPANTKQIPSADQPSSSAASQVSFLRKKVDPLKEQLAEKELTSADQPSSSSATQGSNLQKKALPLKKKPAKKNVIRATDQISPEFSKLRKLEKVCEEQKKKIKSLNEKVRRQKKKIGNLEDLLKELKEKKIINTDQSILLEDCGGSPDFLKRQIAKSKGLPLERKYSEEIRKFALTLHFLSPRAYDYIRRVYNTCLPHPRTLSKWYQNVNAEAGFTKEAFDTLKKKVENTKPQKILCALVLDEMAIRKGLMWDPKSLKYHGRVDYGHQIDCDSAEEANQCLVLMLTCINGAWKLPIGYFFITSLSGEQKSILVENAIKMTEDAGARVVSVTCDGPASNFSMFSALGCEVSKKQDNTSFKTENDNRVHAFIDPCHAIKLVRNTLGDLRVLIDGFGRKIEFKYLELLLSLQELEGLHLGTKLSKAHIFYEKQKMKVRLATQLLSNSVADAIQYCKNELQLQEFEDCEGTVTFINTINNVFDILNSHSIRPPGLKKAMCPANIGFIRAFFEGAIDYLRSIKLPSGELLIESRRKTGFIGLIIDMKSALNLYEEVVEEERILQYIPMYKISQDHLELFFSSIRARGGFNNNPNAVQFRPPYKKLLVRAEIRDGGIGNCISLEQINILTCSSANPVENINNLTEKNRFVDIDIYRVIEYIAGFVSRKLSTNLKCDKCVELLSGPENKKSLIYLKSRGGLKYASADVVNIIKKADKVIKKHLDEKKKPEQYYLYVFKFFVEFYGFDNHKILSTEDMDHDSTHRVLLIKSIIKTYIDIRYRHFGKKASEKLSYRNYFNKLVLFRNE